ncbi:hypothetical protein TNCV_924191 [Trichonephila clavipes]|nr:hypothetical protein TNCV_924191 [Trichonephila clavipes]
MHDRILPVLYGPFLIRKCLTVALACTFTRYFTNKKCLVYDCRVTVDELWYRVEAAWTSEPVHATQFLFDSMPRRISAVITARGGCLWY